MSRRGNFDYNYPRIIAFLKREGYEYQEFSGGQHLKVFGATKLIDLWPSRMTYHIIQSDEAYVSGEWPRLSYNFDEDELHELLE